MYDATTPIAYGHTDATSPVIFRVNIANIFPILETIAIQYNRTNLTLTDIVDYCVMANYCALESFQLEEEITNCILPTENDKVDSIAYYEYCCGHAANITEGIRKMGLILYPHLESHIPRAVISTMTYGRTIINRRYMDIHFISAHVL